jgi:hypothetical protein
VATFVVEALAPARACDGTHSGYSSRADTHIHERTRTFVQKFLRTVWRTLV